MFKTRLTKPLSDNYIIYVHHKFTKDDLDIHLTCLRHSNPLIDQVYSRIDKHPELSLQIDGDSFCRMAESENDEPGIIFEIRAPRIVMYHYIKDNLIPSLIHNFIFGYVSQYKTFLPQTMSRQECKDCVQKFIRRKKHGKTFCPIESEEIKVGRTVCQLPCGHQFSSRAIHKWLTHSHDTCPM